jgi:hypothetical protein
MHLPIKSLLTTLLSLTAVTVSGKLHSRDIYHRDIAPAHRARVASYRSQADTPSKRAVLDQLDSLIDTMDVAAAPKVRKACDAAFGDACTHLLTGKSADAEGAIAKRGASPLLRRDEVLCECTDEDAYCPEGFNCGYLAGNCRMTDKGCGTLGLYVCNGLCRR